MATIATTHQREQELYDDVVETLASALPDVEVLTVELVGPDRFCVYVDRPAGVDHALCGDVTDALRPFLDTYAIDVSSPGPDRPLRTSAHFEAAIGRAAAIRLAEARDGRKNYRGRIMHTTDSHVAIELTDGEAELAFSEIARANLIDEGRST